MSKYSAVINLAKKELQNARKVMDARKKGANNKALATEYLTLKYSQEEATRLIMAYWDFFDK